VGANQHKGEISRQHQEKNNPSSSFLLLEENVNSLVRHWFLLNLSLGYDCKRREKANNFFKANKS
jgi:hypothetical protein